ncbi:MAG: hypothetical protein EOM52_06295 [Clostridia bacterium]|nr:hypothetical protein [Clostridia bacterium]
MKQGTLIQKVTIFLLFLGVAAYLAGAAWRSLQSPYTTVMCYAYTVDDSDEATGLLIREEQVIPGQGGIVDVLPDEGEKVGAKQAVAMVYQSESALERKREIKALTMEAEQLQDSIAKGDMGWDNARLDESIVTAMVGLKSSAATGDLTGLEDQSLSLKSLVLSRESTTSGSAVDAAGRIQTISGELQTLQSAAYQDTTSITVSVPGVFSAVSDGFESILTPGILETLTPSALDGYMAQKPEAAAGAVGRLITSSRWYFAANLPEATANRLIEGKKVTVRFSRDWSGDVSMTVERVSAPQNGKCAVALSATSFLSDTTLLREQTVDVVFSSRQGIRVPKKALRAETRTETDEETGAVTGEYQVNGVYVLTGAQAEFRPVEILADDGDYYLVASPENAGRRTLHSGDAIILGAEELFDGKVVQ